MPETTQFGDIPDQGQGGDGALTKDTILMTRYKIMGVLGGGGQGAVYQARDLNFPDARRLVAIKEMRYTTNDPNLRASTLKAFHREANILATLSHPAIPKIFDFFDINDRAYLVMEFINGSDLELLLTKAKELPVNKVLDWAIELCDVLHYLHTQPKPVIFRDMKPSNIMIDSLGKARLIDFGIAKIFVGGSHHTMIGTEGYSAPEQYRGDASPLSDIYGLGATLHHVLTRVDPRLEPPFSFNERNIQDYNDKVPPGLAEVIERALEIEPANRFQSAAEMLEALKAVRDAQQRPNIVIPNVGVASGGAAPAEGTSFFDDVDQKGAIEPRWTFKTEDEIRASPTVYRDLALVGSYDHNMWAVSLDTGELVWRFATDGGIASSPVVDLESGLVLFGSEDHNFYALNARTGRVSWTYNTRGQIRGTPRVEHGYVFFGSDDGNLYALVASNGRYHWEFDMGAEVRSRPFVTNELVIVGCDSGEIVALELNGQRKWSYRTKRSIVSSPYVDMTEDICLVGSFDGYMYALAASSGYSLWRFRTNGPVLSSPVVVGTLVYFGSTDGNLYAVNTESGREKWKFTTEKAIVGSPVYHEGAIYFGNAEGHLYCVDAKNGKEIWHFEADGAITSTPWIEDNLLLLSAMDHKLYALPLVG